jgi:hypothetical protein
MSAVIEAGFDVRGDRLGERLAVPGEWRRALREAVEAGGHGPPAAPPGRGREALRRRSRRSRFKTVKLIIETLASHAGGAPPRRRRGAQAGSRTFCGILMERGHSFTSGCLAEA